MWIPGRTDARGLTGRPSGGQSEPRTAGGRGAGPVTTPVVLIVESSPELRRMLEESLSQRGYTVASVTDVEEALETLRRTPADLVIADPPSRHGPEGRALDALHREFPTVPSIVVSPDTFDPSVFTTQEDGQAPRRLLRRPFTLSELLGLTRRLLPDGTETPRSG
jgi:two-component system, OmpR family, response regulator